MRLTTYTQHQLLLLLLVVVLLAARAVLTEWQMSAMCALLPVRHPRLGCVAVRLVV
jgi:hypothetical protein